MAELDTILKLPGVQAELDILIGSSVRRGVEDAMRQWRVLGAPLQKRVDLSGTVSAGQAGLAVPAAYFAFTPPKPQVGRMWSVRKLVLWSTFQAGSGTQASPFTTSSSTSNTDTPVTASATGAASAMAPSLPGAAGQTTFVTGFEITGAGATAASVIAATLAGIIGGTATYDIAVPVGANTGIAPVIVEFATPIPASALNAAITLNVPSFGAGNTNAAAVIHGFQRLATTVTTPAFLANVTAGIFVTGQPSGGALAQPPSQDVEVTGLQIPTTQYFSTHQLNVRGQESLVVGVAGAGVVAGLQILGMARVVELDDDPGLLLSL